MPDIIETVPTSITFRVRLAAPRPATATQPAQPAGAYVRESVPIVIPAEDYALIEELVIESDAAKAIHRVRIGAAMIGLCCPVVTRMLSLAKIDYAACGFDPLTFGRRAYTWLHGQGATIADVVAAHQILLPMLRAVAFPRESEVAAELGK